MNTVKPTTGYDPDFIRAVETGSGEKLSACYQCGTCTAGCPCSSVYDLPVNRIMRAVQLGQREAVLSCRALWLCLSCSACTLRCPNNIDVARVMETLRHMARREGRNVHTAASFGASFLDSVRRFGRTWELGVMAAYMARTGRVWTDMDLAPALLLRNRLPYLPHTIRGRDEVARIFRRFEQLRRREEGEA